jgi:IS5 family transposase
MALIDTILEQHPELYEIVKGDIKNVGKDSEVGRQDSPTIEQIVRAALYKEMKKLNYRELEYAQYNSRICSAFIKLEGWKMERALGRTARWWRRTFIIRQITN